MATVAIQLFCLIERILQANPHIKAAIGVALGQFLWEKNSTDTKTKAQDRSNFFPSVVASRELKQYLPKQADLKLAFLRQFTFLSAEFFRSDQNALSQGRPSCSQGIAL